MTLPTDIVFPEIPNSFTEENLKPYIKTLVFSLQNMYEEMAYNVNGSIASSSEPDQSPSQWMPLLKGTTTDGSFTYVNQTGWSLRQGIITDAFFDVSWSATTGTGNLYLELPYLVTKSNNKPFVGTIQSSSISYGAGRTYLTCNAIPSTYRLEIWTCGSGAATANLKVPSSGQIIGHIRYIGISDE